jgi:hypothetical protein
MNEAKSEILRSLDEIISNLQTLKTRTAGLIAKLEKTP